MKIKINLQIFIIAILFYITRQIEIYSILMIFALFHEIGHMIAGILLGFKPKSLTILPFGVSVHFEKYAPKLDFEKKKMIIALAGPSVNLCIAFLSIYIIKNENYQEIIMYTNLLIAVFNLIPIYPLDGGRIMKSILKIKKGVKKAEDMTNKISKIIMILFTAICSIGIIYFKNISIFIIAIYLWSLILFEDKQYRYKRRMYDVIEKDRKVLLREKYIFK